MYSMERLVESNARMLLDALQMRKQIRYNLEHEDLGPLARQTMEKGLEISNYQVKIGTEFREAYREYLRKQAQTEVSAPAPCAEVPGTLEAELVAAD